MIKPTESEPLAELDRFIEALSTIRSKTAQLETGELNETDNPLKMHPIAVRKPHPHRGHMPTPVNRRLPDGTR